MKISKSLLISLSLIALVSCGSHGSISSVSNEKSIEPSSSSLFSTTSSISNTSSLNPSSSSSSVGLLSSLSSSSSASSQVSSGASIASSSSSQAIEDNALVIDLYNPTCGSVSTEKLNATLTDYINGLTDTPIIKEIKNSSCQITNDSPIKGDKVLQIGASSTHGTLNFTFTTSIKSITIKAQTYHKPYNDTWTTPGETIVHNNVDPNSVLGFDINGQATQYTVDLKPDEDEKPLEKEYTLAVNSDKFGLKTINDDKGRVFIKELTLIY